MAKKNRVEGADELRKMFALLEKVPTSGIATKAARAGAQPVRKSARLNAPEDEGKLKKGIILKRERSRVKGKSTYQVTIDPKMNDTFVKMSEEGKRSYYPASQEYGFMTKDGKYVPGYRYMRRAADENVEIVEKRILEITGKELDKVLLRRARR